MILVLEIPVTQWLQGRGAYGVIALGYALVGVGTAMFALPVSVATVLAAMVVLTAGEILYKTTATAHVARPGARPPGRASTRASTPAPRTSGTLARRARRHGGVRRRARPARGRSWRAAPALARGGVRAGCASRRRGRRRPVIVLANPGSDSSRISRKGAVASSWLSRPMAAEPGAVDEEVGRRQVELEWRG